ncbi:ralA-binding protein 1-A-like isoform X1 [Montipora capricornis]|uniref:ralA-binding protein 1-A-like isoform X1 n=1 Tax=Montipora capricornis TaxID=246305 RepID=UPI0035F2041A
MTEREEDVFERKETKKDKGYMAFRSADDDSVGEEEVEDSRPKGKKVKREKSRTLTIRIKPKKQKKEKEKEKDKEKEKEKEKKKKKKSETLSPPQPARKGKAVFGVPLEVATKLTRFPDGVELPRVFREGLAHIDENCLEVEGIYRVSGTKSKVDILKESYDQGKTVNLHDFEAEAVASLVKLYLRELPENILTAALLPKFNELSGMQDKNEQLEKVKQLLPELPSCNRTLLAWLFTHMSHVMEKYSSNRMNLQNIGIVLSPTMNVGHGVLFIFLNYVNELFPDTKITKYNGPPTSSVAVGDEEEDLPSSPDAIASALAKQEAILSQLHEDLNMFSESSKNEGQDEMLWEVQRKVTLLKRKLRHSKKHVPVSKEEDEPKKSQETSVSKDEGDELITLLEASEAELLLEQEELSAIGSELRKRIEQEKTEIERLNEEIAALITSKEADQDLDRSSDSDSTDSQLEDNAELERIVQKLIEENEELERKNTELCHSIHDEREACVEVQVQIRLLEGKKSRPSAEKPREIISEISSKGPMIVSVTSV